MTIMIDFYIILLFAALFPIYTASHASLGKPKNARRARKSSHSTDKEDDSSLFDTKLVEKLGLSEVIMFPFACGAALFSLYYVLKYTSMETINKIMVTYLSFMSVISVGKFFQDFFGILKDLVFPTRWRSLDGGSIWYVEGRDVFYVNENSSERTGVQVENAIPIPYGNILGPFLPTNVREMIRELREQSLKTSKVKISVDDDINLSMRWGGEASAGYSLAVVLALVYYFSPEQKKFWGLTNILGTAFAYTGIQMISTTSFPISFLLLSLLFLYDIYFVFYTEVMLSVATQLVDVPVKLMIPRSLAEGPSGRSFAMLGLGDIVLPGIVISLALRYDLWRRYELRRLSKVNIGKQQEGEARSAKLDELPIYEDATGSWGTRFWMIGFNPFAKAKRQKSQWTHGSHFPKPYFHSALLGYVFGLVSCVFAMHKSGQAQPALLYIVPCLQLALILCAAFKGELRWMWEWSEAEEEQNSGLETSDSKKTSVGPTEKEDGDTDPITPSDDTNDILNLIVPISEAWNTRLGADPELIKGSTFRTLEEVLSTLGAISENEMTAKIASTKAMIRPDQEPLYRLFVEIGKRQPRDVACD